MFLKFPSDYFESTFACLNSWQNSLTCSELKFINLQVVLFIKERKKCTRIYKFKKKQKKNMNKLLSGLIVGQNYKNHSILLENIHCNCINSKDTQFGDSIYQNRCCQYGRFVIMVIGHFDECF